MDDKFDRKEALSVLRKMQDICNEQRDCRRCPIDDICNRTSHGAPLVWELDDLEDEGNG